MPDTNENAIVEDNVIKEQSATIKTLSDHLKSTGQGTAPPPQVIYAPKEEEKTASSWPTLILIGVAVFFLMKRG